MTRIGLKVFDSTNALPTRQPEAGKDQLRLRIFAATDIHMQFLGYDYLRDRPLAHSGLAGLDHARLSSADVINSTNLH